EHAVKKFQNIGGDLIAKNSAEVQFVYATHRFRRADEHRARRSADAIQLRPQPKPDRQLNGAALRDVEAIKPWCLLIEQPVWRKFAGGSDPLSVGEDFMWTDQRHG